MKIFTVGGWRLRRDPVRNCVLTLGLLFSGVDGRAQKPTTGSVWLTMPDRSALVTLQPEQLRFEPVDLGDAAPSISIDERQTMQTIDGFGFALTGGSAELLMKMSSEGRHALLQELFGTTPNAIGVSYVRLSIGASDMNRHVFTYDDLKDGQTDMKLRHFGLGPDLADVVPVMHEILAISPNMKVLGTPWTAPSWMKTNRATKGGALKPEMYGVYANYLVRYIQAMQKVGIRIDAITPQNEPLNPNNTPSMVVSAEEEASFLEEALGPAFRRRHIATKIIVYDHNCDRPDYPLAIFADKDAAHYADGSGFHLYGGTLDAMSKVHDAASTKNLYFTEQMVVDEPTDGFELKVAKPVADIVIGAISNWSRNVLLWNLAADPHFGPHTNDGGCPVCQGAITLDRDKITRNRAFYTIAHASKFVRPGSVRIASMGGGGSLPQVAFRAPDGKIVLIVANPTDASKKFTIQSRGLTARASLAPGAVATYVW